jgi:hypothetical protein
MIFSQRRQNEGSDQVAESFLSFRPQRRPDNRPLSSDEARLLITRILQALHGRFGEDLKLVSLSASGFLNVCEVQENNLQAFADYAPWQAYLKADPRKYAQHDAHNMVVQRWRQKNVYADVICIFQSAGYRLELSSFEKLFVQRADQFACFPKAHTSTINLTDRFPYPGMVHFTIHKTDVRTPTK